MCGSQQRQRICSDILDMTEPISSASTLAITSTGLTILGISTGLQPDIMLAGFAGGLWALSYQPPWPPLRRISATLGSAIIAGYTTPLVVALVRVSPVWPGELARDIAQSTIALLIGLVSHQVLGPAILRIAARRAQTEEEK